MDKLKKKDIDVNKLKKMVEAKGLGGKSDEFGKKYGSVINDFTNKVKDKNLSNEEKARMIADMKDELSPKEQRQFDTVLKALKGYLKKGKV